GNELPAGGNSARRAYRDDHVETVQRSDGTARSTVGALGGRPEEGEMTFRIAKRTASIRDDDLHAYADNLIDGLRRRRVEQYLAQHPEDADRVAYFRHLNSDLADLGLRVPDEDPAPSIAALREDLSGALLRQRQVKRTVRGAVASLLFLVAGSSAWMLSERVSEPGWQLVLAAASEPSGQGAASDAILEISDGSIDEI